jgi:hypothetical protein
MVMLVHGAYTAANLLAGIPHAMSVADVDTRALPQAAEASTGG